jgi:uncharacterized protein YecE (DUF72 family)
MMIKIGVTGWGDHDTLYQERTSSKRKLSIYSTYFPIVELDASYYSILPVSNYENWTLQTPNDFSFIVKAYSGITLHTNTIRSSSEQKKMIETFLHSIKPLQNAGKVKGVLFQFPPWFSCKRENVNYLRFLKEEVKDLPAMLEFRNRTWFHPQFIDQTLAYMEKDGWIHTICDEPQAGSGSVPTVLHPTSSDITLIRFHGRNVYGWNNSGQENWRKVRFLYRYSQEELEKWVIDIKKLQKQTKEVCILFNNNSGGDAADNAIQLMKLLGIQYGPALSEQLGLF